MVIQTAKQRVKNINRKMVVRFFTMTMSVTSLIVAMTSSSSQAANAQLSPTQQQALSSLR
jgi:hypothetical protein